MPPLNRSDLPPNPTLYDGTSNLRILAYPMTKDHILWWARKHRIQPRPDAWDPTKINEDNLMTQAMFKMRYRIPREIKIVTVVYESGDNDFAWGIAFNTRKGLETAADLELIEKVRKVIRASGPPQWYEPDYY